MDKDLIRFLKKVDQFTRIDRCWIWQASKFWQGYGQFGYEGKNWYAHRWSYTYFRGEIPSGLELDHTCKIKSCVNPYHLDAVTQVGNMNRAVQRKENYHSSQAYCKRGHKFTTENTYINKKSSGAIIRYCRMCKRERDRKRIR